MRLLERFQMAIRSAGYSLFTERSYWDWIKRLIKFHKMRHPDLLTGADVRDFLTHLVTKKHVAVNTQQQALSALVFLYKQVLGRDNFTINDWQKSKRPKKLPVVLSVAEANSVLSQRHTVIGRPINVWCWSSSEGSALSQGSGY
ncbi:phage integrase N-terminal SAM-like domain-containing protein [Endozoicomonas sp. ONNA2]|uniref:phage integrase N-terminal SAM-like domain-containing protein n=1 Tax=Endozoicomonas sp. ONNA2 TaxID=2828741 RepID=UPI0021478F2E|nr:phage integrase N-terminal SAM-like domain-containing protein [Endozoicomonas sp. ONNA2]